jgi:hypothetical protein
MERPLSAKPVDLQGEATVFLAAIGLMVAGFGVFLACVLAFLDKLLMVPKREAIMDIKAQKSTGTPVPVV